MQLHRFDNVHIFWSLAKDYLLQHRAEHNLLISLLTTLQKNPEYYPEQPYLAIVTSGNAQTEGILAIALRTPPHNLLLSKVRELEALKAIAQDVQKLSNLPPGVSGPVEEVESFLQDWQASTEQSYQQPKELRIHQLEQINSLETSNGQLRLATESDRPLLLEWFTAFATEVGDDIVLGSPESVVDHGLNHHSIYLWEHEIPVSWANGRQSPPGTGRIGPVYTPPEYRRKGYATACVTALSQKLLDEGCQHCYLFTEVSNPTSNHIYYEIGYRPVCDWHQYTFCSD